MITADQARELLDYDPETGVFKWRFRPRSTFKSERAWATWNTRFSGSAAGHHDNKGYISIRVLGRLYRAHRLAWLYTYGVWPDIEIDHINRVKTDNRIANLRNATQSQNSANTGMYINNTTGFKGVSRARKKFKAEITKNGVVMRLGHFSTPEEAHAAYCQAAEELHGEFANNGRPTCTT